LFVRPNLKDEAMKKVLLSFAVFAMMYGSAQAAMIETTFDQWKTTPVVIGDKVFTYVAGGNNFNNADLTFTSIALPTQTVYDFDINFSPSLINTTIDLDYSVSVTDPTEEIIGLGLDSQIGSLGTDFNLMKTYYSAPGHVGQIAQLVSVNGGNASAAGHFGQLVYTHVEASVPVGNYINSFRDGYSQAAAPVPEPASMALLGFGGISIAFVGYRKRKSSILTA
jgi:hypothetical protein